MEVSCKYIETAAADKLQGGEPPALGLSVGLTTSYQKKKNKFFTKGINEPWIWTGSLEKRPKRKIRT
jgi:hypothetical protein